MKYVKLEHLLGLYRPGSMNWSWQDEYEDIINDAQMPGLIESIAAEGIREPVLLGDDGRVWGGHHRIIAAMKLGNVNVPVKFSGEGA